MFFLCPAKKQERSLITGSKEGARIQNISEMCGWRGVKGNGSPSCMVVNVI